MNDSRIKLQSGFTLIELLIAATIMVLAMAAVYTSFIVQQRSFVAQDEVSEANLTSKIAFNMLVNDIRVAGFGYPSEESPSINGYTSIITLSAGINNSDNITLVGGFEAIANVALKAAQLLAGQTAVTIGQRDGAGNPYLDICYIGSTTFNTTDKRYLSIDGLTYAEVVGIDAANSSADCDFDGIDETSDVARLLLDRDIDKAFPVNSTRPTPVYLIENVTYGINLDNNSPGELQRQGVIGMPQTTITISENIDDFQAVEIDQDGDGTTDRVRINILARTADEDPNLDPNTKPYASGIILEDGNTIGVGDKFRRRIWSMEVALRNPE
jgi:prepilin-type N-terminal cleavage/methylation domain-containing protein